MIDKLILLAVGAFVAFVLVLTVMWVISKMKEKGE